MIDPTLAYSIEGAQTLSISLSVRVYPSCDSQPHSLPVKDQGIYADSYTGVLSNER